MRTGGGGSTRRPRKPTLEEVLATDPWILRWRAMRREEAVLRLVDQGWSRASAEEHVMRGGAGAIAAWQEDTSGRTTAREAKGGHLGDRKSGRRRRKPDRWWWRRQW